MSLYINHIQYYLYSAPQEIYKDYLIMHISENTSDHSPIYCMIDTSSLIPKPRSVLKHKSKPSKTAEKEREDFVKLLDSLFDIMFLVTNGVAITDLYERVVQQQKNKRSPYTFSNLSGFIKPSTNPT